MPARLALEEANRKVRKPMGGQNLMHFYTIHVIAEFNLSGSEIICRQILVKLHLEAFVCMGYKYFFMIF